MNPVAPQPERPRAAWMLPAVVLTVLVAGAVAAFFVTRGVLQDQERRLLEERAGEVSSLLSNSITGIEGPMRVLAALADEPSQFEQASTPLAPSETIGVFAATPVNGSFEVAAAAGNAPQEGTTLTGDRADAIARAVEANDLVAARLAGEGQVSLLLAVPVEGTVVARESMIDPSAQVLSEPGSPYSDLRVALYAGSGQDPDQLVLTTEPEVPIAEDPLELPLEVGADRWTLAIAAAEPLGGAFPHNVPWILLAGGLITAVLATTVAATLARRRSYAMAVVAERTKELRHAQEAAEQANLSKSEFLSRMSHELRTPLNAVLGFGQILEMDELNQRQRDAVSHILKGGQHLLQLINEVLDISRAETGNLSLSPEAVRASDMIGDSVELIVPLADQQSVALHTERSDDWDRHVFADRQRTQQILLNLLSNAVKYNRVRGSVTVSCHTIDDMRLRITVEDTGPGIPPAQLEQLFAPFDRLGAERSEIEGTGMGLALSKRLAEAMDGRLGVDSTPARGSTFWLDLPLVEEPVRRYERLNGQGREEPAPTGGNTTVLQIEDNLSNLNLVERVLGQRPHVEVIAAMQGSLGLELAHQHSPGLILLDLHLPDVGGDEVLRHLRDDPSTAAIPVVIVSADATPGQIQRLQSAGAAAYLTKPIDVQELLEVFDRLAPR